MANRKVDPRLKVYSVGGSVTRDCKMRLMYEAEKEHRTLAYTIGKILEGWCTSHSLPWEEREGKDILQPQGKE